MYEVDAMDKTHAASDHPRPGGSARARSESRSMTLAGLLLFASVYTLAVASPGPGITALVARVLSRGLRGAPAFIAGFVIGDLVWFGFAAAGLAFVAQTFHGLFLAIKYAGVAYLLYLAWKLWTAPVEAETVGADAPAPEGVARLFLAGLALTLGNPKVMIFFMAILPTVVDLPKLTLVGGLEIAAVIVVILASVLAAYALLADRARRFLADVAARRLVNRGCGVALVGAAAAVATR